MTNPLHAPFYADHSLQQTVSVMENLQVAADTFRLRFRCPRMAPRFVPGQFLMLRIAGTDDPLLGRPLAMYDLIRDASGQAVAVDVVYLVGGNLTRRLAECQVGQPLEVWGPLGNGFAPKPCQELVMVAGGIGQTPFLSLGQESLGRVGFGDPPRAVPHCSQVTLCYGARTANRLVEVEKFQNAGIEVCVATEDGTAGHHGLVTDLLRQRLEGQRDCRVVCCGPEPMMAAVVAMADRHGVPCEVSLESPMACGIGICFSCVARVRQSDGSWDLKRTCVEGPVFDGGEIGW